MDVVVVFHLSPSPCRPQLACTAALDSWPGSIVYLFQLSEWIVLLFDVHVQGCEIFLQNGTVVFFLLFDKYCLIIV
jgi:hypothetical protein